jgi:hypothetical protein
VEVTASPHQKPLLPFATLESPAPHNRLRNRALARKKVLAKQCWLGILLVTEQAGNFFNLAQPHAAT